MLALPSLGAVPRAYTTGARSVLAARLALAIAGNREPQCPPRRVASIEIDVLQAELQAWLARMNADGSFIRPRMHLALNAGPLDYHGPGEQDDVYTLWILPTGPGVIGDQWTLERRWKALERVAPGLASAALDAIERAGRHSFALYTPGMAEYFACNAWWYGSDDEAEVLLNHEDEEDAPDVPTRAWFDQVLPRCATHAHGIARARLEHYAHRRDDAGKAARLVAELQADARAADRRKDDFDFDFESQDDGGFRALGLAATLRWNARDPMLRLFDDYAEQASSEGADDALGWFTLESAADLPKLLAQLERMFATARRIERLIQLVATRHA